MSLIAFMDENKIEVCGAPVIFTTEKPPPHNPLRRPQISYRKPILFFSAFITVIVVLSLIGWSEDFFLKRWMAITAFILLYIAFILRKAVIWGIHLYQNKASDETRLRCVFEPSCSEYMILAIKKYGTIIGIVKGIKRLLRCHPPNGGKDYP